jgi:two-component system response regulator
MHNNIDVLIIEDTLDDAELTSRAIFKTDHQLKLNIIYEGEEAIAFIDEIGDKYDTKKTTLPKLIILDLKLPKIDGLGILKKIRTTYGTRNVPVIIFSSSKEPNDIKQAYEKGANSYVVKPVDYHKFNRIVAQFITYWFNTNVTSN